MTLVVWLVVGLAGCCLGESSSDVIESSSDVVESSPDVGESSPDVEEAARELLRRMDTENEALVQNSLYATWDYISNLTQYNLERKLNASAELAKKVKENWKLVQMIDWRQFKDEDLKMKFMMKWYIGKSALPDEKVAKYSKIKVEMFNIYGKAKICDYNDPTKCDLSLNPELTEILKTSRDPKELAYYWQAWRDNTGKVMRKHYKEYVQLSNEAAKLNNFRNAADDDINDFGSPMFEQEIEALWLNLEPLFKDLHAYVRGKLNKHYGDDVVPKDEPIPAHLLGNMWSGNWMNTLDLTVPYPGKTSVDVTDEMVKQGYTPLKMFKMAEDFFVSLNLSPMPELFWKKSIIEKPEDGRDLVCGASAWDFYNGEDFRIKMCTVVTQQDFTAVHHEMGHIQYFIQYKHQPRGYRQGANSGFHEAVGDVIAMSVSTPKHMKRIGLLPKDFELDKETSINFLFYQAMHKVAVLPFIYSLVQWRWDVYRGKSTEEDYNCHYWKLRTRYQGIQPPVERSENDFDPGAHFHIAANTPFIKYFVSAVLQFQFHKSLCETAGVFDPKKPDENPLYNCDIYQSKAAGEKFGNMLRLGSSKPWPDALEVLTGSRKMSTDDLLEFFKPLQDWLKKENELNGYKVGWGESKVNTCVKS